MGRRALSRRRSERRPRSRNRGAPRGSRAILKTGSRCDTYLVGGGLRPGRPVGSGRCSLHQFSTSRRRQIGLAAMRPNGSGKSERFRYRATVRLVTPNSSAISEGPTRSSEVITIVERIRWLRCGCTRSCRLQSLSQNKLSYIMSSYAPEEIHCVDSLARVERRPGGAPMKAPSSSRRIHVPGWRRIHYRTSTATVALRPALSR